MELLKFKYNYRLTIGEHNMWLTRNDLDVLHELLDKAVVAVGPGRIKKAARNEEHPKQWAGLRCMKSMDVGETRTFCFSPFNSSGGTQKEYIERKWGWKLELSHKRNTNVWTFKRLA